MNSAGNDSTAEFDDFVSSGQVEVGSEVAAEKASKGEKRRGPPKMKETPAAEAVIDQKGDDEDPQDTDDLEIDEGGQQDADDIEEATRQWRRVFGDRFKATATPAKASTYGGFAAAVPVAAGYTFPNAMAAPPAKPRGFA